jgi:CheY-specific phosphatase CheX
MLIQRVGFSYKLGMTIALLCMLCVFLDGRTIILKFDSQIKAVAETYYQIYEEMTGQSAGGINFDKIDSSYAIEGFKKAIVIPYENEKENIEGRFVLGISDETMAVKLAAAIAKNAGMPAVERMDDAADILFEFMNTVVGKVITVWDKMGLTADFSPPEFVSDLEFNGQQSDDLTVYTITLKLRDDEKVIITVSLETTKKCILKDKKVLVVDDSKMIRHLLTGDQRV